MPVIFCISIFFSSTIFLKDGERILSFSFLTIISLFIELFYKDLSLKNNKNSTLYSINKFKLLNQINDARQFNLDKKNLFTSLIGAVEHESR